MAYFVANYCMCGYVIAIKTDCFTGKIVGEGHVAFISLLLILNKYNHLQFTHRTLLGLHFGRFYFTKQHDQIQTAADPHTGINTHCEAQWLPFSFQSAVHKIHAGLISSSRIIDFPISVAENCQ